MIRRPKNLGFKKGKKMDIFAKGLVHGFCPKILISVMAVFTEIMWEKIVRWYSG